MKIIITIRIAFRIVFKIVFKNSKSIISKCPKIIF